MYWWQRGRGLFGKTQRTAGIALIVLVVFETALTLTTLQALRRTACNCSVFRVRVKEICGGGGVSAVCNWAAHSGTRFRLFSSGPSDCSPLWFVMLCDGNKRLWMYEKLTISAWLHRFRVCVSVGWFLHSELQSSFVCFFCVYVISFCRVVVK